MPPIILSKKMKMGVGKARGLAVMPITHEQKNDNGSR